MRTQHILLPRFGLEIEIDLPVGSGGGVLRGGLELRKGDPDERYAAAADALESIILAHACAGIDVAAPAYQAGIQTALEAIADNLG